MVFTSSIFFPGRRHIGDGGAALAALVVNSFSVLLLVASDPTAITVDDGISSLLPGESAVTAISSSFLCVVVGGGCVGNSFAQTPRSFVTKSSFSLLIAVSFAMGFCVGNGVAGVVEKVGICSGLTSSLLGGGGIHP